MDLAEHEALLEFMKLFLVLLKLGLVRFFINVKLRYRDKAYRLYCFILTKMAITKKTDNRKCGYNIGKLEHTYTAGGNIKWTNNFGKQFGGPSMVKSRIAV